MDNENLDFFEEEVIEGDDTLYGLCQSCFGSGFIHENEEVNGIIYECILYREDDTKKTLVRCGCHPDVRGFR